MTVRELNGWAPKTVTLGPDGQVLSVTVTQPRFTARERHLLLASRRVEKVLRGKHGIPLDEAMDPANQFAFEVPVPPPVDWAQRKLNEAQDRWRKDHPDDDIDSRMWSVRQRS